MPGKMMAYCGLTCATCDSYIHTQANDMAALALLAEHYNKEYGGSLKAEDCICDGCKADGRKIGYCAECVVRVCAVGRGVETCAHCDDYGCDTISAFHKQATEAKVNLDTLRKTL